MNNDLIYFIDNSDMHLKIDKESLCRAEPMVGHGFGYVWAGARATYGFISGRICYECKVSWYYVPCACNLAYFQTEVLFLGVHFILFCVQMDPVKY